MISTPRVTLAWLLAAGMAVRAGGPKAVSRPLPPVGRPRAETVQTSAAGDRLRPLPPVRLRRGKPREGPVLKIDPAVTRQTLEGIGGAFTESSAFVLAHLPEPRRRAILDAFYGPTGARFTLGRVPMGACDFSVTGRWSYDDVAGDLDLSHFSIAPDKDGFAGAQAPDFGLLSLIKAALAREPGLKLVASPWTAPSWMKDNQDWYGHGKGGSLLPQHYETFARYTAKYLEAYKAEGVDIWGITPINEPLGNGGQWESMEFSALALRDYIKWHLGPTLRQRGFSDVKIIQFDHNSDANAMRYSDGVLGDPATAPFVWGTGLHWYSATNTANPEVMDGLHRSYPGKSILHTEGCIDGIGTQESSPKGEFLGWQNDAWWWSETATDWGFYWAPGSEKAAHPKYTPVVRYARDLINGLNHWFVGWIDWNIVLDNYGGPNHVNNLCGAPVMVDISTGQTYYTPLFYILAHFSRYLRPGDQVVQVSTSMPGLYPGDFEATAAISRDKQRLVVIAFNKSFKSFTFQIQVGNFHAPVSIPAQAIQSMTIQLPVVSIHSAK